ncbi:MAG TPA: DNA polymerase III subunit delta [Bacteroidales bacterium]|nr:DNA polymerase III subunit delta [Bacteroidales bacterium]
MNKKKVVDLYQPKKLGPMTFEAIINNLQNKIYHPIYFLCGEEPYFIDEITDAISKNVLSDSEKEFNQTITYGRDVDVPMIINLCKRFPMMSNYQIVIIKEAQDVRNLLPDPREKSDKKTQEKHPMELYFEKPSKSTILVICYKYKNIDKRKSYTKAIEKNGVLFESSKLYDNKLPAWIQTYLKAKGSRIKPEAALMLSEYLGSDLSKIANELTKLAVNVPQKVEITTTHIEQYIGISKDFNVFELQRALIEKNAYKSFQIINYFAANEKENPPVVVISMLFSFFSKILLFHYSPKKTKEEISVLLGINPYFYSDYALAAQKYPFLKVRQVISLLKEYDLMIKGVNNKSIPNGELFKELIFQILN